jgi:hypothetical protein
MVTRRGGAACGWCVDCLSGCSGGWWRRRPGGVDDGRRARCHHALPTVRTIDQKHCDTTTSTPPVTTPPSTIHRGTIQPNGIPCRSGVLAGLRAPHHPITGLRATTPPARPPGGGPPSHGRNSYLPSVQCGSNRAVGASHGALQQIRCVVGLVAGRSTVAGLARVAWRHEQDGR